MRLFPLFSFKKSYLLASVTSTILLAGCTWTINTNSNTAEPPAMEKANTNAQKEKEDAIMDNKNTNSMVQDESMREGSMEKKEDTKIMEKGQYVPYDPAQLIWAKNGKVVLFFNASWCPNCRTLDTDIRANLDKIPAGTYILSVDYDTYTDLRQKYGVTYQHTFVQVDENGQELKKWNGGSSLNDVLARL